MNVTVDRIEGGDGTVLTGWATPLDDPEVKVHFAGDWRPMSQIAIALHHGEDVEVDLPDWSILSVGRR